LTGEEIGEVDSGGVYTDAHGARIDDWIRHLTNRQHFGWAVPWDDELLHGPKRYLLSLFLYRREGPAI
jgi:hypothetical protein